MSDHKKVISPADLSDVITEELTLYAEDIQKGIDNAGKKAVDDLVRITKDTAPFNIRHHGKHFADCIAANTVKRKTGNIYTWYVKAPHYRRTHLLVHGHMNRTGTGRVKGDPFLHNAWDKVRKQYEKDVEEAVKGD